MAANPDPENPETADTECPLPTLRSLNADLFSLVTFVSRSTRRVSVDWIDYKGCRVQYCVLNYTQRFNIHTYVTHPWVFRDEATEDTLVTSKGESIYYPVAWNADVNPKATIVVIGIPVYSLRDKCLQVVRQLIKREDISSLILPPSLTQDLLNNRGAPPYKERKI